jgi:C4-dicarboxylate-specific signal transduction histidine kinase
MLLIAVTAMFLQVLTAAALLWQRRQRKIAEHKTTLHEGELARMGRFALAGELSASIAHEVAQPLGAILSNADAAGILPVDRLKICELDCILADIRRDALRANQVAQRPRALL